MLGYYIKLLDSYKKRQYSLLLNSIRKQILIKVNSSYFSPEIQHYFKENESGEPFTNFEGDPRQVVQIKEIVNGIYHTEQAFKDLETMDLTNPSDLYANIKKFYYHTVEHGYQGSYLLSHVGVELTSIFSEEIKQLLSLLNIFTAFSDEYAKDAAYFAEALSEAPLWSHRAGLLGGIAIDQLGHIAGNQSKTNSRSHTDYAFLTQFSAALPVYIEKITDYIKACSQQLPSVSSTLKQEKLDELQMKAASLLESLESQRNTPDFLLPIKIPYYIEILRQVVSLSKVILEQVQNLNESSQEVIREKLAELKNCLAQLPRLADRFEGEALLAPGTISNPLMAKLKPFYELLIDSTKNVVDFSQKGQELLVLEDKRFLELRLKETKQRINKANRRLMELENVQAALKSFFSILKKYQVKTGSVNLPTRTKTLLCEHYKYFRPYVKELNSNLDNEIIESLTKESTWVNELNLDLKQKLQKKITGEQETQKLHIKLNRQIIESAELTFLPSIQGDNYFSSSEALINDPNFDKALFGFFAILKKFSDKDLASLPDSTKKILCKHYNHLKYYVINLDEGKVLNEKIVRALTKPSLNTLRQEAHSAGTLSIESILNLEKKLLLAKKPEFDEKNTEALDYDQACNFYDYYDEKINRLKKGKQAYEEFCDKISKNPSQLLANLTADEKTELRRLYFQFRLYMRDAIAAESPLVNLDNDTIEALSTNATNSTISAKVFLSYRKLLSERFTTMVESWGKQAEELKTIARSKHKLIIKELNLSPDYTSNERATHLIKNQEYSAAIDEFRKSLEKLIPLLNEPMRREIKPAARWSFPFIEEGVPFPELQNRTQLLEQAEQVISIKRLFNCVYHLKKSCQHFEKLNNDSYKWVYVYRLIRALNHLSELTDLLKGLYEDPHLRVIASELFNKAKQISDVLVQSSAPYRQPANNEAQTDDKKIHYSPIWYSLQAFNLAPEHLNSLLNDENITPNKQEEIAEHTRKVTLKIESIIAELSSDSVIARNLSLILETPAMLSLFSEFKKRMRELSALSYNAAMCNLREINNLCTEILIEIDKWEDQMGLNPGQLSGPLKVMLDEFYTGLVKPLDCISQDHIALLTNEEPFTNRIKAANERKKRAQDTKEEYMRQHSQLKELIELMERYENDCKTPVNMNGKGSIKQDLMNAYNKVLPILQQYRELTHSFPNNEPNSAVDELLSSEITSTSVRDSNPETIAIEKQPVPLEGQPELGTEKLSEVDSMNSQQQTSEVIQKPNLKMQCKIALSHCKGKIKTWELNEETAAEKEKYVFNQKVQLPFYRENLKVEYISKAFAREVKPVLEVVDSKTDLQVSKQAFRQALELFLNTWLSDQAVQNKLKTTIDIDDYLKKGIKTTVTQFYKNYFEEYAHLDAIMNEIKKFEVYFAKANAEIVENPTSSFETRETLQRKQQVILRLRNLVMNALDPNSKSFVSPKAQIEKIKIILTNSLELNGKKNSFEEIMLAHANPRPLTLAWLVELVTPILQLLGFEPPLCHRLKGQLHDAIHYSPGQCKVNENLRRFSILRGNMPRRYELPFPPTEPVPS